MASAFVVPDTLEVDPDGDKKDSDKAYDCPVEWEYSDEVDTPKIHPEGNEKHNNAVDSLFQSEGPWNRSFEYLVETDAEYGKWYLETMRKVGKALTRWTR